MKLNLKRHKYYLLVLLILMVINTGLLNAQNGLKKVIPLEGRWSFTIGTNPDWRYASYDDSEWDKIRVPSSWEDEGFHDYNGFGYYRKKIHIPENFKGQMLYLLLGYIDDVDEVYFNGKKIGSTGTFPPTYHTAYNAHRKYVIPNELVKYNSLNIIAVKVYDAEQAGGIVSGDIGIYASNFGIKMDVNLQGSWKFSLRDDFDWKDPNYDHSSWDNVFVPSKWEDQGYKRYDGYAWYRKQFRFNGELPRGNMVVIMGRIDDADQVFINGVLVGTTGNMPKVEGKRFRTDSEYRALRGYYFSASLLKKGELNTIAVRVFDSGGEGGIYEGPVGILSQAKYIDFWRKRKRSNY